MVEKKERYAALKYHDFRLLWIGMFVSSMGGWMQMVGMNYHIYHLTGSAFALGMIGIVRFIPIFFCSLIAGAIADTHNRKKIMYVTQVTLAILASIMAITTFTGVINQWLIYLLTGLSAAVMSFDMPARQALVPNLIDKKHLANAMSMNSIVFQTSAVVGPVLAGLAIARTGIGSIYAFNAFSFVAVIIALLMMHSKGEVGGKSATVSFHSIKEGFQFLFSKTLIWSTMILDFFSTFFASATSLLPVFAKEVLFVGPEGLGILYSATSVGALTASFGMAHLGQIRNQGKILLLAIGAYAVGTILFGFSKIFSLSYIALMIIGAGDSVSMIIRHTIRQLVTPDEMRGRLTSTNMIFAFGGPQLGEFEAGLLAQAAGGPVAVLIGGVITLVLVGAVAIKVPLLRNFDYHKEPEEK